MQSTMALEHFATSVRAWDWEYIEAFPTNGLADCPGNWGLIGAMRGCIDKPGHDIHSVVPVVWQRGQGVHEHTHPEHTVIFYVDLGDPPVPILLRDGPYTPERGETLILGPGEPHGVPTSHSKRPRICVALRVLV